MRLRRHHASRCAAAALAVIALGNAAAAQGYPTRPVRLVVGFAPGGGQDQVARLLGRGLGERLGQQVLIENRPGAGTIPATEAVVNAAPDGYTLLLASTATAMSPSLQPRLKYDFLRDIAPVWGVIRETSVAVVPASSRVESVADLIAHAKAEPGRINMASSGIGAMAHMAGELFMLHTGTRLTHVPYRGTAPGLIDLVAGRADLMFSSLPGAIGHIRQGRLRALAVTAGARSTALPDVPAMGEAVPGYEATGFTGIGAPRSTPREIIELLSRHLTAVAAQPDAQARFKDLGTVATILSPADFGKLLAAETEKWGKVIRAAGIKGE